MPAQLCEQQRSRTFFKHLNFASLGLIFICAPDTVAPGTVVWSKLCKINTSFVVEVVGFVATCGWSGQRMHRRTLKMVLTTTDEH